MISTYLKIQHLVAMMNAPVDCSPEEMMLNENIIADVLIRANSMGMPIDNDTVLLIMNYLGMDNFNQMAYENSILLRDFNVRK